MKIRGQFIEKSLWSFYLLVLGYENTALSPLPDISEMHLEQPASQWWWHRWLAMLQTLGSEEWFHDSENYQQWYLVKWSSVTKKYIFKNVWFSALLCTHCNQQVLLESKWGKFFINTGISIMRMPALLEAQLKLLVVRLFMT